MTTQNVTAEIIAVGTELLLGEITDTNSVFIARVLRDIGINIYFMTTVGDNEGRIADAIRIALSRADVIITCGGLGPTVDDMTRQAVAAATGRSLNFHQELLDTIAERFASFRIKMTENNRRQAYLPENAQVIENPVGTAPSFLVAHEGKLIISLPGVPREMKFLMTERVVPLLREHYQLGIIKARVLRTAGIGESMLDELIGQDLLEQANPTVGLAAHQGQVDVRITAKAESSEQADALIAQTELAVRARIGDYVFGCDTETLEDVLMAMLSSTQQQLAISETGLRGAVAARMSNFNALAHVTSHESVFALSAALEMPENTPLRALAEQEAERQQRATNAVAGIAVVSLSDDDTDRADKEERTVVAVYANNTLRTRAYGFGGQSEVAQTWVVSWALASIWRMLKEKQNVG